MENQWNIVPIDAYNMISDFSWRQIQVGNANNKIVSLLPIVKSFYKEHAEVDAFSDKLVEDSRKTMNIFVKYQNRNQSIPKPVTKFTHAFKDYPEIMRNIGNQNFETPSPVQCQAWPIIMNGNDLIVIGQTGFGKKLAFLLPAFIHIDCQPTPRVKRKGPTVLVFTPTRELVEQFENEIKKYPYKGIQSMSIYGDISSDNQKLCLLKRVEIVIATPGHLNDLVIRDLVNLSDVSYLILYGADRMVDLGFEIEIRLSLLKVRQDAQLIISTETWPYEVERLAKSYSSDYIQIIMGSLGLASGSTAQQKIIILEEHEKDVWLCEFMKNISILEKVIIFVNHKEDVFKLFVTLWLNGKIIDSIHGDRIQSEREMALDNLRYGSANILVANDIDSRDMDIHDATVIINYDMTEDIEEYVHRIGCTRRTGKAGYVITLMTNEHWSKSKDLVKIMEKFEQTVPQELYDMAKRFEAQQNREAEGGYLRCLHSCGNSSSPDYGNHL